MWCGPKDQMLLERWKVEGGSLDLGIENTSSYCTYTYKFNCLQISLKLFY